MLGAAKLSLLTKLPEGDLEDLQSPFNVLPSPKRTSAEEDFLGFLDSKPPYHELLNSREWGGGRWQALARKIQHT
jgi:hypothetical protein